jgi:AcrR family transcriptional regulator
MARTRSQDYDSIKQAILLAAAKLFAERSFEATSITEISAAAGLSKAGIYHYFDSKTDILRTMLIEHLESVSEIVDTALNTSEAPREKFLRLTEALIENYTRPSSRSQHSVLVNDIGCLPPKDREFVVSAERRIIRATERLLQSLFPQLTEHAAFLQPITMLYFGMINWTDTWFSDKGRLTPRQLAALVAELILNGIAHTDYTALPSGDK